MAKWNAAHAEIAGARYTTDPNTTIVSLFCVPRFDFPNPEHKKGCFFVFVLFFFAPTRNLTRIIWSRLKQFLTSHHVMIVGQVGAALAPRLGTRNACVFVLGRREFVVVCSGAGANVKR